MRLPPLVLASASPRRRHLLEGAGLVIAVEPADVDEELAPGCDPEQGARLLAERKARAVGARHAGEPVLVIGADTVVALGGSDGPRLLGKPADAVEARAMLAALAGTRHLVVTGVCVLDPSRGGAEGPVQSAAERTFVSMRDLEDEEIDAYVATGEWQGKAGGYAIQETADAFVTRLEEGGFDNVVGLPVALTLELLARAAAARAAR